MQQTGRYVLAACKHAEHVHEQFQHEHQQVNGLQFRRAPLPQAGLFFAEIEDFF
jgi:hypothetical protein